MCVFTRLSQYVGIHDGNAHAWMATHAWIAVLRALFAVRADVVPKLAVETVNESIEALPWSGRAAVVVAHSLGGAAGS